MSDVILKAGTILYRGVSGAESSKTAVNSINKLQNEIIWLSEDKSTASLYGKIIQEYVVKSDIILINLMSRKFHEDYLDKLNIIFTGTNFDGVDEKKIELAIPLGLPTFEEQIKYLYSKGIKIENATNWTSTHERAVQFISNKHRYSTYERDKEFAMTLKALYGNKYQGYITKVKWPSKLHNGMFNRECCIFDISKLIEPIKKGGTKIKQSKIKPIKGDSWNRMANDIWKNDDVEKIKTKYFELFEFMKNQIL